MIECRRLYRQGPSKLILVLYSVNDSVNVQPVLTIHVKKFHHNHISISLMKEGKETLLIVIAYTFNRRTRTCFTIQYNTSSIHCNPERLAQSNTS